METVLFSFSLVLIVGGVVFALEGERKASLWIGFGFFMDDFVLLFSAPMFASEAVEDDEAGYKEEEAESCTPVRRNLLCIWVCSLALWIGRSHSLQRIALSSLQKRMARLSCNLEKITNSPISSISSSDGCFEPFFFQPKLHNNNNGKVLVPEF